LQPWQAKKLYVGNVCGFGASSCPPENYTVRLNTGEQSPLLGVTYVQFAMEGLKHQLSQGAGGWSVDSGPHYTYYKLADSVVSSPKDKDGHEKDFFDGIDVTLPGLASHLGGEESRMPALKATLIELQRKVDEAAKSNDPAQPLLTGLEITRKLIEDVRQSSVSQRVKDALLVDLQTKQTQFAHAANCALDMQLRVTVDAPTATSPDEGFMAVPGQTFSVTAETTSTRRAEVKQIALDLPVGWKSKQISFRAISDGQQYQASFQVTVSDSAQYTRPYWHREDPESETVFSVNDASYATLAFPPVPVHAHAIYDTNGKDGTVRAVGMTKYKESETGEGERAIAVAPPFSISIDPATEAIATSQKGSTDVTVEISSNVATKSDATLRLELPQGWSAEPSTQPVRFDRAGESKSFKFKVTPHELREGRHQLQASLSYGGKSYNLGYSVVTRHDLDTFYYYQRAVQRVSIVDVKVPSDLKVGYIMGAGDDIPTVLRQIGISVTPIAVENIGKDNLSNYGTIVLGIRAYDTQKDLISNNKKLLDYVSNGGRLVVQYNTSVGDFNSGHYTPYPAQLSRARVTVEDAPVQILAPQDRLMQFPNQITSRDFEGWVQERGLYFMDNWDNQYTPLLACQDPGEPLQKGGLVRAKYGKGTYIYTGYAFFRQLPAGVPGAIRLYVNLLTP
jgi:hypothetical protein